jgi:hypothetical protein
LLNKKPAISSGGPRFHSTTTRQPDLRAELRLFGRLEFELRVVMGSNLSLKPLTVNRIANRKDA